jgi:hypothetical protein
MLVLAENRDFTGVFEFGIQIAIEVCVKRNGAIQEAHSRNRGEHTMAIQKKSLISNLNSTSKAAPAPTPLSASNPADGAQLSKLALSKPTMSKIAVSKLAISKVALSKKALSKIALSKTALSKKALSKKFV